MVIEGFTSSAAAVAAASRASLTERELRMLGGGLAYHPYTHLR